MNIRRVGSILFLILFVLFLFSVQISFLLNYAFGNWVNLSFLFALFLFFFDYWWKGTFVALISSYLFDMTSVLPFGVFLFATVISIILFWFFHCRVFKGQAIHVALLTISIATAIYWIVYGAFIAIAFSMDAVYVREFSVSFFVMQGVRQIITHAIIVVIVLLGWQFFRRRFIRLQKI